MADRPEGPRPPALLSALREADRVLSEADPAPALKNRILDAVGPDLRGIRVRRAALFVVPAVAMAVAVATWGPGLDKSPAAEASKPPEDMTAPESPTGEGDADIAIERPRADDARRISSEQTSRLEPPAARAPAPSRSGKPSVGDPIVPSLSPRTPEPRRVLPLPRPSSGPSPWSSRAPRSQADPPDPWSVSPVLPLAAPGPASPLAPRAGGDLAASPGKPSVSGSPGVDRSTRDVERPAPSVDETKGGTHPETDATFDVHVIGIYEASTSEGGVSVHIARSGPMVLVLSAFAATTWTVTAAPEADIRKIFVLGYETQTLASAPDTVVHVASAESSGGFFGCAYEWPDQDPHSGCETEPFLAALHDALGLSATSFHGCYAGSAFTITEDDYAGTCMTEMGYPFTGFP
ncbi:hypothetical protein [Polyangium jinanense]|uniref:Uncharacterized protein n=1 Tax=Polyangium jinanense TaxID=2829994 RepID=A0A9X3XJI4_9BACT|nr:hypothetical protein [Polyangium jinanense]MDC3962850.1 hypothetical protein [Polyangium jinanense]MDC3989221.1 hypothetical protein [Polyangium jinanense]